MKVDRRKDYKHVIGGRPDLETKTVKAEVLIHKYAIAEGEAIEKLCTFQLSPMQRHLILRHQSIVIV